MSISAAARVLHGQQRRSARAVAFHQLKLLQVWQSFRIADLVECCHRYGYTGIAIKALDGASWMQRYDPSADAVGSLEELAQHTATMRGEGLYCFAWTNPLAYPGSSDLALEATLTGQIARTCDGLFLDVEPYAQFWGANQPAGLASQFMRWVRLEAPSAWIALQPDPRPAHLGEIRAWEWMEFCDVLAGQHYWSDFGTRPSAELTYAAGLAEVYGTTVLPTLPGNGTGFPLGQIADFPGFVVWRYGSTPDSTLELLGRARVKGLVSGRIGAR